MQMIITVVITFVKVHIRSLVLWALTGVAGWYATTMGFFHIPNSVYEPPKIAISYYPEGDAKKPQEVDGVMLPEFAEYEKCSLSFTLMENNDGLSKFYPDMPHKYVYVYQINNLKGYKEGNSREFYRLFPDEKKISSDEIVDSKPQTLNCQRGGSPGDGEIYFLVYPEEQKGLLQGGPALPTDIQDALKNSKSPNSVLSVLRFSILAPLKGSENTPRVRTIMSKNGIKPSEIIRQGKSLPSEPLQVEVQFYYLPKGKGQNAQERLNENSKLVRGDRIYIYLKPKQEGYVYAFLKEEFSGKCSPVEDTKHPISFPYQVEVGKTYEFPIVGELAIQEKGHKLENQQSGKLMIVVRATQEPPKSVADNCLTGGKEGEFIKTLTFSYSNQPRRENQP